MASQTPLVREEVFAAVQQGTRRRIDYERRTRIRLAARTFAKHFPFWALALAVALTTGCRNRNSEIVGTWDWGTETVHFDSDGAWGSAEKRDPAFEARGGFWSASGDRVTLRYQVIDPPNPDDLVFTLSQDGLRLTPEHSENGVMTKRLSGSAATEQ